MKLFPNEIGKKNSMFGLFTILFWSLYFVFGLGHMVVSTMTTLTPALESSIATVHGYAIFLGILNYLFGFQLEKLDFTSKQKQIISWSFIIGLFFRAFYVMIELIFSILSISGVIGDVSISVGVIYFIILNQKEEE